MPKNFSKKLFFTLIIQIFILISCFFYAVPIKAATINPSTPNWSWAMPNLQIDISGLKAKIAAATPTECGTDPITGNKQYCIYWISMYIAELYKYAIGVVGILAAVVLMIGGLIWLTAGGNQTRVGEAKSYIGASLTGLIIALSSYLILYQINPELVNLKPIKVTQVKGLPTATTTLATFVNQTSPELSSFISCMQNHNIPNFTITSTTDTHIAQGTCNPTNPSESFSNPARCQHTQYSCHYGGKSCTSKGSYAIDIDDSADGKKVAEAAAGCGGVSGNYNISAKCILNENGNHHHVSIGAWYNCNCDTSMASCASQK